MTDVSAADARKHLADLINRVAYGKERVVLTRHGKQLCALVPIEDLSFLDKLKGAAESRDIAQAESDRADGSSILWPDLKRELGFSE